MSSIFDSLSSFFGDLTGYIPDVIINSLVAVSLLFLVYFLFVRFIFVLCKADKALRIADIVFLALVLLTLWITISPVIKIDKNVEANNMGSIYYTTDDYSCTLNYRKNGQDVLVMLGKTGANDMFDFKAVSFDGDDVFVSGSDWFSPVEFCRAELPVAERDPVFTGGNHDRNGVKTGVSQNIRFYADGNFAKTEGSCSSFLICWTDSICGFDTISEEHLLQVDHVVSFNGENFFWETYFRPLADIYVYRYYGLSVPTIGIFAGDLWFSSGNSSIITTPENSSSGDRYTDTIFVEGLHTITAKLSSRGLGSRPLYIGDDGAFCRDYGKAYFNIIQDQELSADSCYYLAGIVDFDGGVRT